MLLKKSFMKITTTLLVLIVVFATGFATPPITVYADSTPTLEEVEKEVYELGSMLSYSWPEQNIIDQDAKAFALAKAYSATHSGDKLIFKFYLDEYSRDLESFNKNLAHYKEQRNEWEISKYEKIVATTVKMQSIAQTSVVGELHFTVNFDTAQKKVFVKPKSSSSLSAVAATVKIWNDTTSSGTTTTLGELTTGGFFSTIIKSGYHAIAAVSFIEPDLGQLTYTTINPGWDLQADGKWKYYDATNNSQPTGGWLKLGNAWYSFQYGYMDTGWMNSYGPNASSKEYSRNWYYFGGDGKAYTGWNKLSNSWYNFDSVGAMRAGWQKDGNSWYYLGKNNDGRMATGWKQLSDKWYYFGGAGDGKMKTGWYKVGGKWYYSNSSGAMQTGKVKIGGKTHTFNPNGVWAS
jgi:glucan-binding YG repeat protein